MSRSERMISCLQRNEYCTLRRSVGTPEGIKLFATWAPVTGLFKRAKNSDVGQMTSRAEVCECVWIQLQRAVRVTLLHV